MIPEYPNDPAENPNRLVLDALANVIVIPSAPLPPPITASNATVNPSVATTDGDDTDPAATPSAPSTPHRSPTSPPSPPTPNPPPTAAPAAAGAESSFTLRTVWLSSVRRCRR